MISPVAVCVCVCVCVCAQGAAKALIFPVVQQFTEAFVHALQMPDGASSDSGLKMEVLKVGMEHRCITIERRRRRKKSSLELIMYRGSYQASVFLELYSPKDILL